MSFLHGAEVVEVAGGARPIQTASTSVIGLVGTALDADDSIFPLNTPVLITSLKESAAIGLDGTLPAALDGIFDQGGAVVVLVRVDPGASPAASAVNVIGGVDEATGNYTGMKALLSAKSVVGVKPRILIAPGFTQVEAVLTEFISIADGLRGFVYADGPNTNDADAITYQTKFGSKRCMIIDPWVKVLGSDGNESIEPSSARIAGVRAQVDNKEGYWVSISNHTIKGIIGTARAVDFALGDFTARANILNENHITTIIQEDGYRIWGARTVQTTDTKWLFESVVRVNDVINDSILAAHLWAIDKGITKTYVEDVTEGVKGFLRKLESDGAIVGGDCWADPEANAPANIQLGNVVFDYEFTPPYPCERLTFRSALVNNYLKEIF
jgi:Phage tail sheath protein FI